MYGIRNFVLCSTVLGMGSIVDFLGFWSWELPSLTLFISFMCLLFFG